MIWRVLTFGASIKLPLDLSGRICSFMLHRTSHPAFSGTNSIH